jgi:hypothetical protein
VSWSWSDAWVLTAAYFARENPVTLERLFAAGDALNHALFLDRELEHGLTLLSAAKLARLEGEMVVLTDEGVQLCERAIASTDHMLAAMKKVEEELRRIDLTRRKLPRVEIPHDAVSRALEQYHKSWR